ncbi:MAG: hypothetical protein L3J25_07180 [Flavobacteriaceae bacterium]|nr:hypothetical protein [Flavobacteriaceae bacterium]
MKQHFKKYLKLGMLLFSIFLILVNCQKDDFQELQETKASKKPPNLTATIQRGGKLIESNKTLKEQLAKFTKSENSEIASRTIYSSEYDFSIDTTYTQLIETSTYNSFTFSVERDNPDPDILENYVFTSFNNGNTKQYLISYPIVNADSDQEYDIANATIQSINDDTLIYSRGEGCWASIVEYEDPVCVDYNCGLSGNHSPGEACDDGDYRAYTECTGGGWVERCTTPGGGGTSGGSDYDPDDTTNGGNTNTDTNTDNTTEDEEEVVIPLDNITKNDCDTSKEDLKKVFPNMPDTNAELLASIINDKGKDFGIDSDEDLWHFLSQAGHETGGFNTLQVTENLNYSTASLIPKRYSKFTMDTITNPTKLYAGDYTGDAEKLANAAMCCKHGNSNEASGDGWKYRGRGIVQLTWKDNYTAFKTWYNNKYDPDIDPVTTPNLISTNDTLAILTGLWYYKTRVVDKITVDSTTTVDKVTLKVNGGDNGLPDRKERFQKAKDSINCL